MRSSPKLLKSKCYFLTIAKKKRDLFLVLINFIPRQLRPSTECGEVFLEGCGDVPSKDEGGVHETNKA